MKNYFSFDPEDGFEFHDTAEEAQERAQKTLDAEKDAAASDGWNDNTNQICWGEVKACAEKTMERVRPPDSELDEDNCDKAGNHWPADFDSILDYELKPVENATE